MYCQYLGLGGAAVLKFKASGCSKETSPIPWFLDGRVKKIHHKNGRDVWFTLSGLGKLSSLKRTAGPCKSVAPGWHFLLGPERASPDVLSSSVILVEKHLHKLASFFWPKSQLPSHHNKFVLPGLQAKAGMKIQVQVHSLTPTSPIATSSMALTWHSWELRYFSSDRFVKTGVFSHILLRSCLYMFITFSSEHHQMLSTQSPLNTCFFYHCFFSKLGQFHFCQFATTS